MFRELVALFFLVNAIFWGLFDHHHHCALANAVGVANCPPHYVHLIMGFVSYLLALVVVQWKYLFHK
jgi:hypothetical protein